MRKENNLYRTYRVSGQSFSVYFDFDERLGESFPAYPDFEKYPKYTSLGQPFVTAEQNSCRHVKTKYPDLENCGECIYFFREHTPYDPIGICMNEKRILRKGDDEK